MECRSSSILELSLKNEQLILHTAQARAIKAMVEQFLRELKKASVGHLALPGFPGLRLQFSQGPWYSWVLGGGTSRAGSRPPTCLQDSGYVIALRSYITDDHSLLSFHRGDLIKLQPAVTLEPGNPQGWCGETAPGQGRGGEVGEPSCGNAF